MDGIVNTDSRTQLLIGAAAAQKNRRYNQRLVLAVGWSLMQYSMTKVPYTVAD